MVSFYKHGDVHSGFLTIPIPTAKGDHVLQFLFLHKIMLEKIVNITVKLIGETAVMIHYKQVLKTGQK